MLSITVDNKINLFHNTEQHVQVYFNINTGRYIYICVCIQSLNIYGTFFSHMFYTYCIETIEKDSVSIK